MMHDHPWKQTKLRNLVAYSYEELLDMKNGYHQDTSSRHGPYIVRGDSDDGVLRTVNSKDFPKGVRPRPCVVDLIVPERTVTSIYGAGGVVKSTLVLDLLLCAARGDDTWAGRCLGGQYDGLFIDLELDLDEQANRARRLCWGRGHKELPEGFNYICGRGHSPQAVFNHAYKDCEQKGFKLVAIDSAGLAIMGNATEYRHVVSFFQGIIDAFIINLGCTVILIDHQGNVQAGESYQAKTQFGSSYKGHLTRSRVQLQLKESGKGIRRITARHNKANFTDYADPFDLTVRYMDDAITITAETMDTAELAQEIQLPTRKRALLILYRENGPMARQDIADAASVSNGTVGNVLTDLRKEEHVRDCGRQPDGTNPVEITPLGIKFVEEFLSEYTNDIITSHPPYKDRDDDDVDDGVDGGGGSPDRDDDDGGGSPTPPTLDIPRDDVVDDAEEHLGSYFRISDESGMYMVKELIASSAGPIAVDTETSSLNIGEVEVALIQVKIPEESNPIIVDCSSVDVAPLLEALKDKEILGHNLAYDLAVLRKVYGYEHAGDVSDTQLMFQVFYGGTNKRAGLQDALGTVLGVEISKDEQTADWMGYITPEMLTYAATDVRHLHALKDALAQKINDTASHLWAVLELEHSMVKVTAHMKATGMPVDQGVFAECVRESKEGADKKLEELDELVTTEVPEEFVERNTKNKKKVPEWRRDKVNWNSPEQVLWAFKEVAGIELKSTSKEVLPEVNHPIAVALMEYRKVLDVSKRFSETKLVDGRVYAGWNQLKARTGRMSCEKPPLQGIPTPLRRAFVAPEGHKLIVSDLSQIEIRVLAAACKDEQLIEDLAAGRDVHRRVAASVFSKAYDEVTDKERKMAKRLVFGTLYGQGISGFTASVNAMTGKHYTHDEVARDFMGPLFAPYPKVKTWMDRVADEHKEGNKVSYTPLGRRRLNVPDVPAALNTPIQAGATDVMKAIAVAVYRTKEPSWELVGIVHDEILMEVPQEAAEDARDAVHKIMVEVGQRVVNYKTPDTHKVPVDAETHVCDSWAEKE